MHLHYTILRTCELNKEINKIRNNQRLGILCATVTGLSLNEQKKSHTPGVFLTLQAF